MKKSRKTDIRIGVFKTIGLALCVIPAAIAVLSYFPLWERDEPAKLLSGFTVLLLALAARPLFKMMTERFMSAASLGLWLVCFIAFFALERIAGEMVVISFVGLVSNILGAVLMKLGDRMAVRGDEEQ